MLKIRFSRVGRTHTPFFRIVITEHRQSAKHGYIKVLGFYNPVSKEFSLDKAEAEKYVSNGAQYSDSLKKVMDRLGK